MPKDMTLKRMIERLWRSKAVLTEKMPVIVSVKGSDSEYTIKDVTMEFNGVNKTWYIVIHSEEA